MEGQHNNSSNGRGSGRGRGGGRGGGRGRGGHQNHQNTPISLNDIIQFIKFNKSNVKLTLDNVPEFEQGFSIPEKVVNDETWYPEKDFEAHLHREQDRNPLIYQEEEIINIPRNLHELYDPNYYYTFGLRKEFTFPYSILYQHNKDFGFMNHKDKLTHFQDWKSQLMDTIPATFKKKKSQIQSFLQHNSFEEKLIMEYMSNFMDIGLCVVDLNENSIIFSSNVEYENNCIVFKCSEYYFPLIHMYGKSHNHDLIVATTEHFTKTE